MGQLGGNGRHCRRATAKILIRAAFTALSFCAIGVAHSQPPRYHAPAQNFYQNNFMEGGGG
jgi:hypothetical protein